MKRPIEVRDIRVGDLIRYEPGNCYDGTLVATEYRPERDCQAYLPAAFGQHYLLDRPKPAVELPTTPTFGVLAWTAGPNTANPGEVRRVATEWVLSPCISSYNPAPTALTQVHAVGLGLQVPRERVTAFTPATAVPTSELDVFRDRCTRRGATLGQISEATRYFLAAVDAANGGAA